ncbi:MAG: 30S ribosomal protein S20 [Blastocatellia bacterium]|nr:30S ribosomal protein S20 [Blastocatellia bacterium]
MANHKSAIKRIRQNEKRRAVNRANGSRMRTEIKRLRSALALGDVEGAKALLPAVMSVIDKSIQKGVVHRNAAARYKSRLTARVNTAKPLTKWLSFKSRERRDARKGPRAFRASDPPSVAMCAARACRSSCGA